MSLPKSSFQQKRLLANHEKGQLPQTKKKKFDLSDEMQEFMNLRGHKLQGKISPFPFLFISLSLLFTLSHLTTT